MQEQFFIPKHTQIPKCGIKKKNSKLITVLLLERNPQKNVKFCQHLENKSHKINFY